jgi:hypothetical protein
MSPGEIPDIKKGTRPAGRIPFFLTLAPFYFINIILFVAVTFGVLSE